MADLKRWFKVWTSILDDPSHSNLSLEDAGRWVRLGAMTAMVGDNGRLLITRPARRLCQVLEVPSLEEAFCVLRRLPNIEIEEGESVNDVSVVTWKNWTKYQKDHTVAERVKRFRGGLVKRSKRREEESREDKTRGEPPPPTPPPTVDDLVAKLGPLEAYRLLDVRQHALNCQSWCVSNRRVFSERRLVNWLNGEAAKAASRVAQGAKPVLMNPKSAEAVRRFAAREDRP